MARKNNKKNNKKNKETKTHPRVLSEEQIRKFREDIKNDYDLTPNDLSYIFEEFATKYPLIWAELDGHIYVSSQ